MTRENWRTFLIIMAVVAAFFVLGYGVARAL
jgi:preprotein translocase subunit SecE